VNRAAIAFTLALWPLIANAVLPHEQLADPALEARARTISRELRCQVCQNQSIDDSNAPLAADLRKLVRERLSAGDKDEAVLAFVVARYGDYVRLTPPMRRDTLLLWLAPILGLGTGVIGIFAWNRRRNRQATTLLLSAEEQRAFDRLLAQDGTERATK
jgi:cytochrome c-type biogenesis protein CcmH